MDLALVSGRGWLYDQAHRRDLEEESRLFGLISHALKERISPLAGIRLHLRLSTSLVLLAFEGLLKSGFRQIDKGPYFSLEGSSSPSRQLEGIRLVRILEIVYVDPVRR